MFLRNYFNNKLVLFSRFVQKLFLSLFTLLNIKYNFTTMKVNKNKIQIIPTAQILIILKIKYFTKNNRKFIYNRYVFVKQMRRDNFVNNVDFLA